ncbi:MAG: sulfite exporter TauE/SafE family protein [Opitutus sp.]|nr:sulfite exporter TauE/SafE family protein [Opitutus sp.]
MNLSPSHLLLAILAAFLVGVAKTGIGGLGMLAVVLFAQIMPAKQATGMVLPLLCFGDLFAYASYRQHAKWSACWKLFPWTAAGVVAGYFALGRMSEHQTRTLIGGIVLGLVVLHFARRRFYGHETDHGAWFAPAIGVLAGFTTLVANAAGPFMAIYFLAMRLPKMDFVGTGAVFFLLLNLFKLPFMVNLGLVTKESFTLNLLLAPAVVVGGLIGRTILKRIEQRVFENLALAMSAVAGLKLLL